MSKDAAIATAAQAQRKVSHQLLIFVASCHYTSIIFSLFVVSAADTTVLVPLLSPLCCEPVVPG